MLSGDKNIYSSLMIYAALTMTYGRSRIYSSLMIYAALTVTYGSIDNIMSGFKSISPRLHLMKMVYILLSSS